MFAQLSEGSAVLVTRARYFTASQDNLLLRACWLPVTFLLVNNCVFFHLNPAFVRQERFHCFLMLVEDTGTQFFFPLSC